MMMMINDDGLQQRRNT